MEQTITVHVFIKTNGELCLKTYIQKHACFHNNKQGIKKSTATNAMLQGAYILSALRRSMVQWYKPIIIYGATWLASDFRSASWSLSQSVYSTSFITLLAFVTAGNSMWHSFKSAHTSTKCYARHSAFWFCLNFPQSKMNGAFEWMSFAHRVTITPFSHYTATWTGATWSERNFQNSKSDVIITVLQCLT